jgi:alkylation response protein AidB-like acyl-CoA dehydrogenase
VRMTGRWSYASGAQFATWASLSGVVTDEAGAIIDAVMGFVPTSELTMEDTWHTTGMRGTAPHVLCDAVTLRACRSSSVRRL